MKRKFDFLKEPWGANIIILLLITVALWAAYNLLHTGEEKTMPRVSVIVEDSSNERWTAFRLGIDQAAREYGVDVAFIASPEFESAQDQKNLISQEAAGGADALILSLYDSEMTDIGTNTMKTVFVETDGIRDNSAGSAAVVPSGRKMGEALGEMLLKKSGPAPYVSVFIGNLLRYSEKEMLQGLTETVEGAGGSILLIETDREYMMTALPRSREADAIAVLEDPLLMRAAELSVSEELPGGRLFGIGCSPSNISYLDRGVISGMIIPNEFTMGYQSLAQLSRCLSNDIPVMKDIEIGFSGVLTEEVHDPENEKLLFPVVQ